MVEGTPTIPAAPEGYRDPYPEVSRRGLEEYKSIVFRDSSGNWLRKKPENMVPNNPEEWSKRYWFEIKHYTPKQEKGTVFADKDLGVQYHWDWKEKNVFGGFEGFFSEDSRILDLGSGFGLATEEINKKFKRRGIVCVGLDYRYLVGDRPENLDNFIGGNFGNLPFKDASFDRILSVESFPAWLPSKENIGKYFQEITRVSKRGTIWRGTLPNLEYYPQVTTQEIIDCFAKNGWEIVMECGSLGANSFIAKLIIKKET